MHWCLLKAACVDLALRTAGIARALQRHLCVILALTVCVHFVKYFSKQRQSLIYNLTNGIGATFEDSKGKDGCVGDAHKKYH